MDVRDHRPRDGGPRGALPTAAGPHLHAALHDLALPTFRQYARTWDWAVVLGDLPADGTRRTAGRGATRAGQPRSLALTAANGKATVIYGVTTAKGFEVRSRTQRRRGADRSSDEGPGRAAGPSGVTGA